MLGHRMIYGASLLCAALFYFAYGQWLSGIVLAFLLALPWFSLLLSLPAILLFRVKLRAPALLTLGEPGQAGMAGNCPLPSPPFHGKLRLQSRATGKVRVWTPGEMLPTDHCGAYVISPHRTRVCDYLGLFSFPLRQREETLLVIRPRPVAAERLPDLRHFQAKTWRPKFGGGFGENHELRLYRPGDSLNQVHWKLSAKTGKLTIREPMEPLRGLVLLTLNLRGTEEARDRKFGRLLWLGKKLLSQEVPFDVRALTGDGVRAFSVAGEEDLWAAIDTLLCAPLSKEGDLRDRAFGASWQYHIGGDPDVD